MEKGSGEGVEIKMIIKMLKNLLQKKRGRKRKKLFSTSEYVYAVRWDLEMRWGKHKPLKST